MIRVTIELIPHGNESEKSTLETIAIINTGLTKHGYYTYDVVRPTSDAVQIEHIFSWDRSQNVLPLVEEAIHKLLHVEEYSDQ